MLYILLPPHVVFYWICSTFGYNDEILPVDFQVAGFGYPAAPRVLCSVVLVYVSSYESWAMGYGMEFMFTSRSS